MQNLIQYDTDVALYLLFQLAITLAGGLQRFPRAGLRRVVPSGRAGSSIAAAPSATAWCMPR